MGDVGLRLTFRKLPSSSPPALCLRTRARSSHSSTNTASGLTALIVSCTCGQGEVGRVRQEGSRSEECRTPADEGGHPRESSPDGE